MVQFEKVRLLGWTYAASLVVTLRLVIFADVSPEASVLPRVAGGLVLIALGFLGARWYHGESVVFWLFFRLAQISTDSAEPEDKCLISFFVLVLLAAVFLIVG